MAEKCFTKYVDCVTANGSGSTAADLDCALEVVVCVETEVLRPWEDPRARAEEVGNQLSSQDKALLIRTAQQTRSEPENPNLEELRDFVERWTDISR